MWLSSWIPYTSRRAKGMENEKTVEKAKGKHGGKGEGKKVARTTKTRAWFATTVPLCGKTGHRMVAVLSTGRFDKIIPKTRKTPGPHRHHKDANALTDGAADGDAGQT
eukprot:5761582-Amphidinium_carterae.1